MEIWSLCWDWEWHATPLDHWNYIYFLKLHCNFVNSCFSKISRQKATIKKGLEVQYLIRGSEFNACRYLYGGRAKDRLSEIAEKKIFGRFQFKKAFMQRSLCFRPQPYFPNCILADLYSQQRWHFLLPLFAQRSNYLYSIFLSKRLRNYWETVPTMKFFSLGGGGGLLIHPASKSIKLH